MRAVSPAFSLVVGAVLLTVEVLAGIPARAQAPEARSAGGINLGGRGWSSSEVARTTPKDQLIGPVEFSVRGGLASDYIYRGTTLSDRKPAVGAAIEAAFGQFYAGGTVASVKLPTQPAAELTVVGGVRPTLGRVNFDFNVTYFAYPGEALPSNGINYWEAGGRADFRITEQVGVAAGYAYSPNVSNTAAWSQYAAAGVGFDVPARLLPADVGVSFTAGGGYSWFGNQSASLGGFPLPSYLNWQAGVTFTRKALSLDLRYHNTNLSKENCFVFTGDPNARPGGRIDPITNPAGLMSNWCSAAVVAKLWFALE
jgi:uncharacterized protein (TIGR02001 family)